MFKRRDIPPVLLLLLLIILVMLTLSQILVVHNGRYGRSVHNMRKLQLELREIDVNLHALMMQNVPSIELNRRLLQNQINAHRFAEIISKASRKDPEEGDHPDLPSSRLAQTVRLAAAAKGSPSVVLMPVVRPDPGGSGRSRSSEHHLGRSLSVSNSYGSDENGTSVVVTASDRHPADVVGGVLGRMNSAGHQDNTRRRREQGTASSGQLADNVKRSLPQRWQGTIDNVQSNSTLIDALRTQSPATDGAPSDRRLTEGSPVLSLNNGSYLPSHGMPNDGSPVQSENTLDMMRSHGHRERISYCPSVPPLLRGNIGVNLENSSRLTWDHVAAANPDVEPGGAWSPRHCVARHRVAIIIPYRDREQHLITLLYYLHPVLQRQQLDYRIYVVEQYGRDTFNKARIMNIAFVEALKQYHFQCFVFHDVDLVPEDDRNMYSCPQQPRHMSVAIDEMGYKLAYQELVGGVLNMRTEHFQRVNGYSNLYWGWGAEDDDMAYRIMHVGLKITRPPETTARYKMAKHTKRKPSDWRKRAKLLYTGTRRFQFDGLNSLQYKVTHIKEMPLYTHLLVDIGRPPRGF